ncbi:MAG: DUF11 domain-containing protein, partial [Peptococcaceae bacterium]|nr:DUF11 domain-containing protein [Peptococcaceae bacterium]
KIRRLLDCFGRDNNIVSINIGALHQHSCIDTLGMSGPLVYAILNGFANLTLVEVPGSETGMAYDGGIYTIVIEDGVVVEGGSIGFTNDYLKPVVPNFRVAKSTNVDTNEVFRFTYKLYDAQGMELEGSGGIVEVDAANGFGLSAKIDLPQDFSGKVVVIEIEDVSLVDEGWLFDRSTKTLTYVLGVCASVPVAPFTNNYFGRDILFTKDNNQGETEILAKQTPVTFTLTVVNRGSENLVGVTVSDTWFALLDTGYAFDVALSEVGSEGYTEPSYQFDGETLSFEGLVLRVGEALVISYTIVPMETGTLTNEARVTAYGSETGLPVYGGDSSAIIVRKPNYELVATKLVAEFTDDTENLSGYDFAESVSFASSGKKGIFVITITNNSEAALYLTDVKDVYKGEELPEDAVFYREDGSESTLAGIREEFGALESGASFSFYFITDALTAMDTYKNEVEVTAVNGDQEEISDQDSAVITVSWNSVLPVEPPLAPSHNPDPDADPDPNPDSDPIIVDIPEIAGPLASYLMPDEEEFMIADEEIPLGNLPKTGTAANVGAGLLGLFTALSAMGAAGATLLKKEEE